MIIQIGSLVSDRDGNQYKVTDYIGSGGFGVVYRITQMPEGKSYALKTIQTPFADERTLKSFVNEGTLATEVSGKNVITYHYFHSGSEYQDLPPYIIMDYADGGTLAQLLELRRREKEYFSDDDLNGYFRELVDGMEIINAKLIHRDIKPDNILIDNQTLKISDFGLSKIVTEATRSSTFKGFGCLQYMAPEAWREETNTLVMDIYSMGIVYYELSTLQHPLKVVKESQESWRDAHLFQNPRRPDELNHRLSPVLTQVVMKMMNKKASDRFQRWSEVRDFLNKGGLPRTPRSEIVDTVLKRRLEIDQVRRDEDLARQKKEQELADRRGIVLYQFKQEIIRPLEELVEEINSKYSGPAIHITASAAGDTYIISSIHPKKVRIQIQPLDRDQFYREVNVFDYGPGGKRTSLQVPTYKGVEIVAWGSVEANDGRGFNLLLLESKGQPYGDWHLLLGNNGVFGGSTRPEPFPFESNEIERALARKGSIHEYAPVVRPFDRDFLTEFIAGYL
jgi:serine/threonine protein kinase